MESQKKNGHVLGFEKGLEFEINVISLFTFPCLDFRHWFSIAKHKMDVRSEKSSVEFSVIGKESHIVQVAHWGKIGFLLKILYFAPVC